MCHVCTFQGQLMREVDALDGLSARIADQSAITYQVQYSKIFLWSVVSII